MPVIDARVVCHCLAVNTSAKPVAQRKRKVYDEKRVVIDEEVGKLSSVRLITKIKYLTWLANVVLVGK